MKDCILSLLQGPKTQIDNEPVRLIAMAEDEFIKDFDVNSLLFQRTLAKQSSSPALFYSPLNSSPSAEQRAAGTKRTVSRSEPATLSVQKKNKLERGDQPRSKNTHSDKNEEVPLLIDAEIPLLFDEKVPPLLQGVATRPLAAFSRSKPTPIFSSPSISPPPLPAIPYSSPISINDKREETLSVGYKTGMHPLNVNKSLSSLINKGFRSFREKDNNINIDPFKPKKSIEVELLKLLFKK